MSILETALGMTESFYEEKSQGGLVREMKERKLPVEDVDDPALRDLLSQVRQSVLVKRCIDFDGRE